MLGSLTSRKASHSPLLCAFCGEPVEIDRIINGIPHGLYFKNGGKEDFCDAICSEAWEREFRHMDSS